MLPVGDTEAVALGRGGRGRSSCRGGGGHLLDACLCLWRGALEREKRKGSFFFQLREVGATCEACSSPCARRRRRWRERERERAESEIPLSKLPLLPFPLARPLRLPAAREHKCLKSPPESESTRKERREGRTRARKEKRERLEKLSLSSTRLFLSFLSCS